MSAFESEARKHGRQHSIVTLQEHLDVFLHTYIPTRGQSKSEDLLDEPLTEIGLLQQAGERRVGAVGRYEPVYVFRREAKPEITKSLFEFCLNDYWERWHPQESTLTFRDIAYAEGSIGQVFKLPEDDIRARLEAYVMSPVDSLFEYQPSFIQGSIRRRDVATRDFLRSVYQSETSNS